MENWTLQMKAETPLEIASCAIGDLGLKLRKEVSSGQGDSRNFGKQVIGKAVNTVGTSGKSTEYRRGALRPYLWKRSHLRNTRERGAKGGDGGEVTSTERDSAHSLQEP
jgi:hypothetical protein